MKKVIDIDKIFDDFLVRYIDENRGKYNEKQWEQKIPTLYDQFGVTALAELDGLTPETYYKDATADELVNLLKIHVEEDISVSDYLCEALITSDSEKQLAALVNAKEDEELVSYCVNILNDKNSTIAFDKYFEMILDSNVCEDMKDLLAEMITLHAECAKERALSLYEKADGVEKLYFLEILCSCKNDDRIYNYLIKELEGAKVSDMPLYLSYITRYGDDRALPVLMRIIERQDIDYLAFKELKLAIEAFGGEYTKKRNFANDKFFKRLKGQKDDSND